MKKDLFNHYVNLAYYAIVGYFANKEGKGHRPSEKFDEHLCYVDLAEIHAEERILGKIYDYEQERTLIWNLGEVHEIERKASYLYEKGLMG